METASVSQVNIAHNAETVKALSLASPRGNGGIGDGGSPNNTDTLGLELAGAGPFSGPASSIAREAPGLDVSVGGPSLDHQKKARSRLNVERALVAAGWYEVADKVHDCGRTGQTIRCNICGGEWIAVDRCHHRLCPYCAPIRAAKLYELHKHLAGRPNLKHLILTFKNTPELSREYITWMISCFTRLRRRQLFARAWRGGVYAMEFTYTEAKGFHPHIHAMVDGDYVPQAEIAQAWLAITGNSEVVWIERAKRSKQALKYILKPSNELLNSPKALDSLLSAVLGRHFVSGWGRWYRVTEKSLREQAVCPYCGSSDIEQVGLVLWSEYYGKWVSRSPPRRAFGPGA